MTIPVSDMFHVTLPGSESDNDTRCEMEKEFITSMVDGYRVGSPEDDVLVATITHTDDPTESISESDHRSDAGGKS